MFKRKPVGIVSEVSVWRKTHEEPFTIASGTNFDLFATMWRTKEKTKEVWQADWMGSTASINVVEDGKSLRWIYHPSGKVWVLSKTITPVYQVSDPDIMNEILGIDVVEELLEP